jgi:sortase A
MKVKLRMQENRVRRVVRLALLVVGIVCLGIYCEAWLYRTAYQMYADWKFDHTPNAAGEPARAEHRRVTLPAVLPDPDHGTPKSARSEEGDILGRISIPRLDLSAIVEEGVDETTLSRAVGHIPGTALPGEVGNIGIAGHRDTFFRKLKDLRPSDEIDLTTHSGHYRYVVDSLTVVEPSDVGVLEAKGGQNLTIVTCFPFKYIGNAPRRFIVHAVAE